MIRCMYNYSWRTLVYDLKDVKPKICRNEAVFKTRDMFRRTFHTRDEIRKVSFINAPLCFFCAKHGNMHNKEKIGLEDYVLMRCKKLWSLEDKKK